MGSRLRREFDVTGVPPLLSVASVRCLFTADTHVAFLLRVRPDAYIYFHGGNARVVNRGVQNKEF